MKSCHFLGANNGAYFLLPIGGSEETEVFLWLRRGMLPFRLALRTGLRLSLTIVCRGEGEEEEGYEYLVNEI